MSFISDQDIQNYGSDFLNVAQRAAAQYAAPHLQALDQQNASLAHELARERRARLDSELERAIPNYREIDNMPEWHRFLLGIHNLSGRVRRRT